MHKQNQSEVEKFLRFLREETTPSVQWVVRSAGAWDLAEFLAVPAHVLAERAGGNAKTVDEVLALQQRLLRQETSESRPRPRIGAFARFVKAELSAPARRVLKSLSVMEFERFLRLSEVMLWQAPQCRAATAVEILSAIERVREASLRMSGPGDSDAARPPRLSAEVNTFHVHELDPKTPWKAIDLWLTRLADTGSAKKDRNETILRLRLGVECASPHTLDGIASRFGVSRERVRQIVQALEVRASSVASQATLAPLFEEARRLVCRHGGQLTVAELTSRLLARGEGGENLAGAHGMIAWFGRMHEWSRAGLSLGDDGIVRADNHETPRAELARAIMAVGRDRADQRLDRRYWSVTWDALKTGLLRHCRGRPGLSRLSGLSDSLIAEALETPSVRRRLRPHGGRVYTIGMWRMVHGTLEEAVEEILYRAGGAMHHTEVDEVFRRLGRRGAARRQGIHSVLDRAEDALLWGDGMFINRAFAPRPHELLADVEKWLTSKLRDGPDAYCIHGVFDQYREQLVESGIANAKALYASLRERTDCGLQYLRFPVVMLPGRERKNLSQILAECAARMGGPFSVAELRLYAGEHAGMKPWHVNQRLRRCTVPDVVEGDNGMLCHVDYLEAAGVDRPQKPRRN